MKMAPSTEERPITYWDHGPTGGTKPLSIEGWQKIFDSADKYGFRGAYHPKNQFPGSPWTPTWKPTKAEFMGKLQPLAQKVLADRDTLKMIVERHRETLEKRWMKKTKKKQRDLLLMAWPNMAPAHRPDFEAYRQENTGKHLVGLSKYPESYLWPDINLQDLSSRSLVIFINSRGQYPPSAFARTDINSTHLATVSHAVEEPAFLPGYTLFMDGDSMDTYGRLVPWNNDSVTIRLMLSQRQFTPGDGLRVLQIQDRIYPFLIKCCELILHDLSEAGSLLDLRFPVTLETPMVAEPIPASENEILPTLATISAEAPYRPPAHLNLERVRGVLAARRSAAEDHLFALREDPGYFADTIRDWSDHRNDALLDTEGNPHPTGPHTIEFWERVIRNVIAEAHSSFMNWDSLWRQITKLCGLKEKHKDEISYDKQLPEEYLIALLHFREILKVSAENPMHYLKNIQSSPPLRQYFTREPQRPGTINMLIRPKSYSDAFFHKPWGLLLMLWDEDQRNLIGFTNLIDAFEQLFQDPDIKKYLSRYVADLFGDLGIFSRILHELELYQPWGATFDDEHEKHQWELIRLFGKMGKAQMEFMDQMDSVLKGIVPLAMPADGKFNYPADKKRTKENHEAMIKAEENLDYFWAKFDGNYKRLTRKTIDAAMGDHISKHRGKTPERTPPWVEPPKEIKAVKAAFEPQDWDDSPDTKIETEPKRKRKTKGVAQPEVEAEPELSKLSLRQAPRVQKDNQPTFKVSSTALKVFNILFYIPNQTHRPGEIPWRDFLQAMASTGFAIQKMYGSIWQFTPTNLDVERSIQFHEPHPGVKLPYTWARRIGRRLTLAYGWRGDMFELDEGSKQ